MSEMSDNDWTAERVAELRRRATTLRNAEAQVAAESVAMAHAGAWGAPLDDALSAKAKAADATFALLPGAALLSLLDALESARESERSKTAELQLASEQVSACAAELERVRAERDEALQAGARPGVGMQRLGESRGFLLRRTMKRSEIPRDSGTVVGCYRCKGSEEVTVMMRGANGEPYPYVFTCECRPRRADERAAAMFAHAREVPR